MTKGAIVFLGERVEKLSPSELVKRGCIQVMEGRYCFGHLTIEENLLTGAFTRRDGRAAIGRRSRRDLWLLSKAQRTPGHPRRLASGGEQQMCAIGRAMMSRPKMILLDEPSMGLAPQVVEEIFAIMMGLNKNEGVSFLLAEQNTNLALKYASYGYILENGRLVLDGEAAALRANEDVKEFYLGIAEGKRNPSAKASTISGGNAGWRDRRAPFLDGWAFVKAHPVGALFPDIEFKYRHQNRDRYAARAVTPSTLFCDFNRRRPGSGAGGVVMSGRYGPRPIATGLANAGPRVTTADVYPASLCGSIDHRREPRWISRASTSTATRHWPRPCWSRHQVRGATE